MEDINTASVETKQYLAFRLGNEEYGIDIRKITTIVEKNVNISRVPKTPGYVKGVINLRGEIIPVISLRLRFGLPDDIYGENTRIIIVKLEDVSAGLLVDSVAEVLMLDENSTDNISSIAGELSLDCISGVGKYNGRIITLLNLEKLIEIE